MDVAKGSEHCAFCKQVDFLPFRCPGCQKQYCLEHRKADSHQCSTSSTQERQAEQSEQSSPPRKAKRESEFPCTKVGCKNDSLQPNVCKFCLQNYCLTHRFVTDHACARYKQKTVAPKSSTPATTTSSQPVVQPNTRSLTSTSSLLVTTSIAPTFVSIPVTLPRVVPAALINVSTPQPQTTISRGEKKCNKKKVGWSLFGAAVLVGGACLIVSLVNKRRHSLGDVACR